MGWMDAHEYLVIERTLLDRLDEVERFSLERAFHSEAADGDDCATEDAKRMTPGLRPGEHVWRPAHTC
jgi:hypothetical protein